jgi:hypothetical protein
MSEWGTGIERFFRSAERRQAERVKAVQMELVE